MFLRLGLGFLLGFFFFVGGFLDSRDLLRRLLRRPWVVAGRRLIGSSRVSLYSDAGLGVLRVGVMTSLVSSGSWSGSGPSVAHFSKSSYSDDGIVPSLVECCCAGRDLQDSTQRAAGPFRC